MDVIIIGAGWCGLATAMLLRKDGHSVTVLEMDADGRTGDPWESWERPGVAQFRQPHLLMPRGRCILDDELPEVSAGLLRDGGGEFAFLDMAAHLFPAEHRTTDDGRFRTYAARRPVLEAAARKAALEQVDIRAGAKVTALLAEPGDLVPTVTGVVLDSGEELRADLVVDATGRRDRVTQWLSAIGARPPVTQEESEGFTYYTRFFRSGDGSVPGFRGPMSLPYGSITILTIPSDNGTWSVTMFVQSRDRRVKEVRDAAAWTRVVAACEAQAHWLDGKPMTDVLAFGGALDKRRDLVDEAGEPLVHGYATIGDAWSSTNPSLGRGLTMALMQAQRLRDVLGAPVDSADVSRQWADVLATELGPWFDAAVATDRERITEIDAIANGQPPPPATDPTTRLRLAAGATGDPHLFRALFDVTGVHALPADVVARPGVAAKLDDLGPISVTGSPFPGPDRAKLLELIASD